MTGLYVIIYSPAGLILGFLRRLDLFYAKLAASLAAGKPLRNKTF